MKSIAALAAAAFALTAAQRWPEDWADHDRQWVNAGEFAESKAICRAVRDREPPAADRPDAAAAKALEGCDSEALYYGIGMPADPVKARQCAFLEAETEDYGDPFAGRAMLMTIYANGVGAARDLDVAAHLACRTWWAPAEADARVLRLARAKTEGWTGTDFHYCDEATSGHVGGQCAGHAARIARAERAVALAALTAGWTGRERTALTALQAAHEAYSEAHASGEIDMTGTLRLAFWHRAKEKRAEELLGALQRLESGAGPGAQADLAAADAALNAAYRNVMGGEFLDSPGSVTPQGVRDAQRAWLRYRDAFLAFAALKWPDVPQRALAAWLTEQRTVVLEGEDAF